MPSLTPQPASESKAQEKPKQAMSTYKRIGLSLAEGLAVTVLPSPAINLFNGASVVACRYAVAGLSPYKMMYNGSIYNCAPDIFNFSTGLSNHLYKECTRLAFKMPGLGVYLPYLQLKYDANTANLLFALSMSASEFIIEPFDTRRVRNQSGEKGFRKIRDLYKGAPANSARQFVVWSAFNWTTPIFNELLAIVGVDPSGAHGFAARVIPQAVAIQTFSYPIEFIKNKRQFGNEESGYYQLFKKTIVEQGLRKGLYRGFWNKLPGAAIQHAGALGVTYLGKKRAEANQKEQSKTLRA